MSRVAAPYVRSVGAAAAKRPLSKSNPLLPLTCPQQPHWRSGAIHEACAHRSFSTAGGAGTFHRAAAAIHASGAAPRTRQPLDCTKRHAAALPACRTARTRRLTASMQATAFAGASISGQRLAFKPARRCSHVAAAGVAVPAQVRGERRPAASDCCCCLAAGRLRLRRCCARC